MVRRFARHIDSKLSAALHAAFLGDAIDAIVVGNAVGKSARRALGTRYIARLASGRKAVGGKVFRKKGL
jgi:hypothetical protein